MMLADDGEVIADLAVLRDQADVFASVASTPTAWQLLADLLGSRAPSPRPFLTWP
jgi:glycine cleavage system aminomethyltransferase T